MLDFNKAFSKVDCTVALQENLILSDLLNAVDEAINYGIKNNKRYVRIIGVGYMGFQYGDKALLRAVKQYVNTDGVIAAFSINAGAIIVDVQLSFRGLTNTYRYSRCVADNVDYQYIRFG